MWIMMGLIDLQCRAYRDSLPVYFVFELGKTLQAKKLLLKGPVALLREPIYYYNMGCYDALLGNPKSAQVHLLTSFKMDPSFREIAKKDPDLKAVRELI